MEQYVEDSILAGQTVSAKALLGKRLLAKNGAVVGRIVTVCLDPKQHVLAGVYARRRLRKVYVCSTYFAQLSNDAVVLSIDPLLLWHGARVLSHDGELVGKVKHITRKEQTNTAITFTVRGFLRGTFDIPIDHIASFGDNVVLKKTYNVPKRSIWNYNL